MAKFSRGIAPELLVSQVRNTMPYLFDSESPLRTFSPAQIVRLFDRVGAGSAGGYAFRVSSAESLSHFEYYRLCLSSHYLTCGTPVPTDVDNQIRQKLWPRSLPLETALEMVDLILESRKWDFTRVSTRFVYGAKGTPWEKETLSGHLGEWFTVACGAYSALGQYSSQVAGAKREEVRAAIADEVNRHSEIFGSLWRAKDGIGCLKASASIAHNFGDLDRVMDMWALSVGDPLRLQFYKLGAQPFDSERKLRYQGRLWVAGELYKSKMPTDGDARSASNPSGSMALENHRHFALRKPRSLRSRPELVIPTAPFFDDWGATVARALAVDGKPSDETLEIVETLKLGWDRQPGTVAYGRGLHGMISVHEELRRNPHVLDAMKSPFQHQVLKTSREKFEASWAEAALAHMDEIPSRAE